MSFKFIQMNGDDLNWPDRGNPNIRTETGGWGRTTNVHPRPMYPHNPEIVERVLRRCEEEFPIHSSVHQHLTSIDREFESGFNGYAFKDHDYYNSPKVIAGNQKGEKQEYSTLCVSILLSGKPVPPMPEWTAYLVSHEYGHCAWFAAEQFLGYVDRGGNEAENEYMAMRGHPNWKDGKRWHQLASEVIANDFRITVMKIERSFWQHDVPHPDTVPAVREWWMNVAPRVAGGIYPEVKTDVSA